jgi:hypothetical protein
MAGPACGGGQFATFYSYFYTDALDGGRVIGVPAGGGPTVPLVSAAPGRLINYALAFDEQRIYFGDELAAVNQGAPAEGRVMTLPRLGGEPTPLATGLDQIIAMAVDGDALYLLDWAPAGETGSGFVGRLPLAGGDVQRLADIPSLEAYAVAIAAHAGYVYWTQHDGLVQRVPGGGGATEVLASGEDGPGGIVVGDGGAYWFNVGGPSVDCVGPADLRHLDAGGAAPVTVAPNLPGVSSLAVGPNGVYWSTVGAGCLPNLPTDQGAVSGLRAADATPFTISDGLHGPSNLFVDGPTLYFTLEVDADTGAARGVVVSP